MPLFVPAKRVAGMSDAGLPHRLIPANFTTLAHFSVSATISFPRSAGEPTSDGSRAWSIRSPARRPRTVDEGSPVRFVGYDARASEIPPEHPISCLA